jgi:hypothetical protein
VRSEAASSTSLPCAMQDAATPANAMFANIDGQ